MICSNNHSANFIVHDKDGTHWCALCELEAQVAARIRLSKLNDAAKDAVMELTDCICRISLMLGLDVKTVTPQQATTILPEKVAELLAEKTKLELLSDETTGLLQEAQHIIWLVAEEVGLSSMSQRDAMFALPGKIAALIARIKELEERNG